VQTIVSELDAAFRKAITAAFDIDADPLIGVSQNQTFGDYQSNAAMGLAKRVAEKTGQKPNPRAVAEQIKSKLDLGEMAQEITIAGPGFINIKLSPTWLGKRLASVADDPRLGIEKSPNPETVVVDYSGPNIAKQMHVGHLRSTIIGDSIARTLEFQGHNIIRQNHVGDWGTQFGMVILGIWHLIMARHRGEPDYVARMASEFAAAKNDASARRQLIEKIHLTHQADLDADKDGSLFARELSSFNPKLEEIELAYKFVNAVEDTPESQTLMITREQSGARRQTPLARVSNDVIAMLQEGGEVNRQERSVWDRVRQISLAHAQEVYDKLGATLRPEHVKGESEYHRDLGGTVEDLRRAAHAAGSAVTTDAPRITVEESEGALVVFHATPGGQPMFLNKEKERLPFLIRKSDGAFLYATTDLAALRHRVRTLHAGRLIYVTDARQALHFEMLFATARGAGWTRADDGHEVSLEHVTFGSMLDEKGKPIKTRSGENVKLIDLLEEAEERAFAIVSEKNAELSEGARHSIAHAVGIGAVKYADLSKDRTSDYVFSWDRMLAMEGNTAPYLQIQHARIKSIFRKGGESATAGANLILQAPQELLLAKHLIRLGEIIDTASRELKPHLLSTYLYDLATKFSSFYTECPVLKSEEPTRSSRLLLCKLTAQTWEIGLDLLGIEHPDEM